jgi:hypothetical protein
VSRVPTLERQEIGILARWATGRKTIEIADWTCQRVHTQLGGSGEVFRVGGRANEQGKPMEWSVVLKVVHCPDPSEPSANASAYNYWKREPLAYGSGLLDNLGKGLRAPQCFGVFDRRDGTVWLWLEDIVDECCCRWPLSKYGAAARDLGSFNGAYLAPGTLPSYPWLSKNWLPSWLGRWSPLVGFVQQPRVREHPLVRRAFPASVVDRVMSFWTSHSALLETLDRMPKTLCHRDANQTNLLTQCRPGRERTIAIDWAFVGSGALGEEIAQLVASSLLRVKVEASVADELSDVVFSGYLEGLREAGWRGTSDQVRIGYTAGAALRWVVPGLFGIAYALDERRHADAERTFGRPIEALMDHWGAVTCFLLKLNDEAETLLAADYCDF